MLKLRVNPLVLAAALGLLGPAALEEEEANAGPVGLWLRSPGADPSAPSAAGELGERIEVLALEDRFFIDDGLGSGLADQGSWSHLKDGALLQELRVDSGRVLREFRAEADGLAVRTRVEQDGSSIESISRYTRLSV